MKPILSRGVLLTLQSAGAGIVGVAALVALLALLSGCASTTAKPFSPEPGKQGYVISCGGDLAMCYAEAQKACPSGFDQTDSSTVHDDERNRTKSTLVISCKS